MSTAVDDRPREPRTPSGRPALRVRGINYDTGFAGAGYPSRRSFDPDVVRRELTVIAHELHCTAVRVSDGDLDRLVLAGRAALDAGPVAVTEFGCCTYRGAADRGGLGWAIIDGENSPARLDGPYERSEAEQVDYLRELLAIFADEGIDAAFWFTFAGYELPHRADPLLDLDMASYGVVKMHEPAVGPPTDGLGWQPKKVFAALAEAYRKE